MMLRLFYRCVLRLHPPHFRRRFRGEMLWLFDQQNESSGRAAVLVDGFVSLARQWLFRPGPWEEAGLTTAPVRSPDGVPLFHTFESTAPRSAALLNGMLLSVGVFGALAVVIAHGGPAGVMKLPRVVVVPQNITPEEALALELIQPRGARAHREQLLRGALAVEAFPVLGPAGSKGLLSREHGKAVASGRAEIVVAEPRSSSGSDSMIFLRDRDSGSTDVSRSKRTTSQAPAALVDPLTLNRSSVTAESGVFDPAMLQAAALLSALDKNGDGVISYG